jgi:peptidyl-prolyl cis-trans isomerase SurA
MMLQTNLILKYLKINPYTLLLVLAFVHIGTMAQPQGKLIDQIIAVVGNHIVKQSDIDSQKRMMKNQMLEEGDTSEVNECEVLEDYVFQQLMLDQAKKDSIIVSEAQVESELDRRIRFFVMQIGSEKKLEEYYGKSIVQIKDEFRTSIKNQLLTGEIERKITGNLTVTPAEVKAFYNKFPTDSLPFVNAEVEIGQIVAMPQISKEAKLEAKEKLNALRERILKGEKFNTLAVLYSEDPGSARKGGELGLVPRGTFVPEFEAAAYNLKPGEVSKIIETEFGYHVLQLIERRGDQINVRHILISPKIDGNDLFKAKQRLDTVYTILKTDTLGFAEAAMRYSDDDATKDNGGLIINPQTGTKRFEMNQIDPTLFFVVDKLKVGEFSEPQLFQMQGGKQAYRILYLKVRTEPHRANLKDDYQRLQDAALAFKKNEAIRKWVAKKMQSTYIRIIPQYASCKFETFQLPAP